MPVPNTLPRSVRPIHPGEMLREDFMLDYGQAVAILAATLGVSRQAVNQLSASAVH